MSTCIIHGDMLTALPMLAANSVDAVVTDPPYHLTSVSDRFGSSTAAPAKFGTDGAYARASRGFMGQTWDGGDIAMRPETWAEVLRVLKPGGHMVAFGGSRTYHRIACAIEDAGFEIRDSLMWLYGTGFPKSHDVSKGIDKAAGAIGSFGEPKSVAHAGWIARGRMRGDENEAGWQRPWMDDPEQVSNAARKYIPATPEAAQWQGWGTALKPGCEPIILARKPLDGTVAANTLKHGVGGINIDACRVDGENTRTNASVARAKRTGFIKGFVGGTESAQHDYGRWPANLLHDGSDDVMAAFAAYGSSTSSDKVRNNRARVSGSMENPARDHFGYGHSDSGTAARFFYSAKASKADRAGSKHPTVKPIALMSWLVKLITPPGGTVLDPFAGSGTTLAAASRLGFNVIGIEQSADYVADIYRRMV